MKRMLIFSIICSTGFLNGMETNIIDIHGTSVILINEDIYRRPQEKAATITVLGVNEQNQLRNGLFCVEAVADVGQLKNFNGIVVRDKIFEKLFVPGTLENPGTFIRTEGQNFRIIDAHNHAEVIPWNKILIAVTEPTIRFKEIWYDDHCRSVLYYHSTRRINNAHEKNPDFWGKTALEEAQKDLQLCYENALKYAFNVFPRNQEKSIAFPLLGRLFGFSCEDTVRAMILSIFKVVEENKGKCSKIILGVKDLNDFNCCKLFFETINDSLNCIST